MTDDEIRLTYGQSLHLRTVPAESSTPDIEELKRDVVFLRIRKIDRDTLRNLLSNMTSPVHLHLGSMFTHADYTNALSGLQSFANCASALTITVSNTGTEWTQYSSNDVINHIARTDPFELPAVSGTQKLIILNQWTDMNSIYSNR